MACRAVLPVATGEAGAALLPGHTRHSIAKALPNVPIDLQVHNNKATVIAGSARYTLAGIPPDQFPAVPDPDITQDIQMDAALLRGILKRTLYAIGSVGSRFTLHGLYLELSGGLLTAVGTDGHRLVVEQWDVPAAGGMTWSGILPKRAMQLVAKRLDGAETVFIGLSYGRLFHASVGSFQLSSRLIEGTYPNWRALAPKRPVPNALTVSRSELMAAIKRAGLVAESGLLTLEYGELGGVITAKSSEHGEAIEELHASYVGEGFRTGFQADYLTDTLAVQTGEVIVLQQDGTTGALAIMDPAVPQTRACVMPIRLQ